MIKKNTSHIWASLFLVAFSFWIQNADAAKLSKSGMPVEREFDAIREFHSYDPATDRWSKIEEFRDIEILKNSQEKRKETYLYRDFWAYDAIKGRWHKVDIRNYGYERAPNLAKPAKPLKPKAEPAKETPKKSTTSYFGFLKNWVFGGSIGGAYSANIMSLEQDWKPQIVDKKVIFTPFKNSKSFELSYPAMIPSKSNVELSVTNSDSEMDINTHFVSIPITGYTHYTFFDRIRVGVGGKVDLSQFYVMGNSELEDTDKLEERFFHNPAYFGIVGVNLTKQPKYNLALDFKFGQGYDMGPLSKVFKKKDDKKPIDSVTGFVTAAWNGQLGDIEMQSSGTLLGAALNYEEKLDDYWKYFMQLGVDHCSKNVVLQSPESSGAKAESITLSKHSFTVSASVGLQVALNKEATKKKASKRNRRRARRRR